MQVVTEVCSWWSNLCSRCTVECNWTLCSILILSIVFTAAFIAEVCDSSSGETYPCFSKLSLSCTESNAEGGGGSLATPISSRYKKGAWVLLYCPCSHFLLLVWIRQKRFVTKEQGGEVFKGNTEHVLGRIKSDGVSSVETCSALHYQRRLPFVLLQQPAEP